MKSKNQSEQKTKLLKEQAANKFWSWFDKNQKQYMFLNQVDEEEEEKLLDKFANSLHKFNENIYFERFSK